MTIVNKATYLRLFQEKDKRLKQILNEQENLINEIVSIYSMPKIFKQVVNLKINVIIIL